MSGKVILITILAMVAGHDSYSQKGGEVEDRVVVIEKEAKLDLPEVTRNFQKGIVEPQETTKKVQQYTFEDVRFPLSMLPAKIKVPTIPADPLAQLYGNYIKGGFGNYTTTYLEGYFSNKRSDKILYGAHVKHLSSGTGPVEYKDKRNISSTSDNQIEAFVKYFYNNITYDGGINYTGRKYNYYGFNKSKEVDIDTIKQLYNFISLRGSAQNTDSSKLSYKALFNFNNFSDKYIAKENEIIIAPSAKYLLDERKTIDVSAMLSLSKKSDSSSQNRTFFQIKPAFILKKDALTIRMGVNAAYTNDTVKAYDKLHVYPSLQADYTVNPKTLTVFAGIDGEMQKNTLNSFVRENPFLGRDLMLFHTNKSIEFYAGARGNLMEKLNYLAKASIANYKNLFFFNNSRTDSSKFEVLYYQGNSTVTSFLLDISYESNERFRLNGNINFFGYNIGNDSMVAWHRPNVSSSVGGVYNFHEKIYISGNIYYISGLRGRNFITDTSKKGTTLPGIFDVNVKLEYRVSPRFSAFLEGNNLLGRKYERFLYYKSQGVNVLAGVNYSF